MRYLKYLNEPTKYPTKYLRSCSWLFFLAIFSLFRGGVLIKPPTFKDTTSYK